MNVVNVEKDIQQKAFDYAKTQTWEYISDQWLALME